MTSDTPADGALAEAIAELQMMDLDDGDCWTEDEVRRTQSPNDLRVIATILNAVLSGALIPRPAEPAQAAQVDWEARRWEAMLAAMQGLCANPGGPVQANSHTGWDFVNCQSDGVAKVARSLADDLIAAAQEGRE